MASTSTSTQATPSTTEASRGPSGDSRGGRRGGRRGGQGRGDGNPGRGSSGRRGGRGGRTDNPKADQSSNAPGQMPQQNALSKPPLGDHDSGGGSSERPTGAAAGTTQGAGGPAGDDVEAEVCFICASDIVHQAVTPCNHRTCHECSLRSRALYKSRLCLHCRTESPRVIFTDSGDRRFEDFTSADFVTTDDILGISYESKEIEDDTTLLLRYNCPDPECEVACFGWPDLHRHVKSLHQKVMCDLCTRNKKVFTHEHALYTQDDLRKHEKHGDRKPGEADTTGFKGHPHCGFCNKRFYGDDELFVHCRDKHEKCHVCERQNPHRQHQYYVNYNALEQHFRKDHFQCPDTECLEKKFVVFASEMDLKAHQLEAHPNGLSKDAKRDARRVDMSEFDIRQHEEQQPRRRGRGGAQARGRDPNTEPLPASTAQPLSRAELAYQRQMEIQTAQSVTTRTFGGQLTSGNAYAARPGGEQAAPTTVNVPRSATAPNEFPRIQNLSLSSANTGAGAGAQASTHAQTPQEQARLIQHNAVVDRAAQLLAHDSAKITSFRNRVSQFRTGALNATQMIDALLALFDVSASDLGKLVKELADLYDSEAKRTALLKAWNDWRAINEDYPTLPGPSGALPNQNTVPAGRRILKLKSSTSQSQRAFAAGNQSRGWGSTPSAGPSSSLAAPRPVGPKPGAATAVPWGGASAGNSARATPAPSRPASGTSTPRSRQALPAADAFPSLPAAAKPNLLTAGRHRGAANWDTGVQAPVNAWSSGGASSSTAAPAEEEEQANAGKKKGRKGKQQTLYQWG